MATSLSTAPAFAGCIRTQPATQASWETALHGAGLTPLGETGSGLCLFQRDADVFQGTVAGRPAVALRVGRSYRTGDRAAYPLERLAADVLEHGATALLALGGSFAVCVAALDSGEVWLAIDRHSIEHLYLHRHGSSLAFATRSRLLAAHPGIGNRFRAQAVYDYLYFHSLPAPNAGYAGMERLLPGHAVTVRANAPAIKPYWAPSFDEVPIGDPQARAGELREILSGAVAAHVPADGQVGCFLSGGLDSSTVTGLCQQHAPGRTTAFTIGFRADGYDEMEFAAQAARHFAVPHATYYVTPDDIVADLPRIIGAFDGPFGNASALPVFHCARLAASRDVTTMLAGDGGDELFGGNTRYARQLLLERYHSLPAALRRGLIEPLTARLARGPFAKVASYVAQARLPLPERMMSYNLLHRIDPRSFLTEELLGAVSPEETRAQLLDMYPADESMALQNRLLQYDWRITLADSDLPKVTRMCELAGVSVTYPMLDEALIHFAAQLPAACKVSGKALRPFYRQAYADFLPQATLTKSKQGFGLPFGVWLREDRGLQALVSEALAHLQAERILNPGFERAFFTDLLPQHASYYGTLGWLLACLSLWMRQHGIRLT